MAKTAALIGAGFIAGVHAEALTRLKGATLKAVVDPAVARAEKLARAFGAEAVYDDLDRFLADGGADVVHVLTPPPSHRPLAERILRAGHSVFLEKPMAETAEDCAALQEAARAGRAALRVNQNFVHHPAYARLKRAADANRIGPVRHVACRYVMPLRQLAAGQFGHWMFDSPRNLLLEQAVHPLSTICDLLGPVRAVHATPGATRSFSGLELATDWMLNLECDGGGAQLQFSMGASYPVWSLAAIGTDGALEADFIRNRTVIRRPGPWIEFVDDIQSALGEGGQLAWQGAANAAGYLLSTAKVLKRRDPFFVSMRDSIADFYRALDGGRSGLDGGFGAHLVDICEEVAACANIAPAPPAPRVPEADAGYDVVVLGATGFIGRALVARLVADGKRVAAAARNVRNLPDIFRHENVGVYRGSIADPAFLADLLARAPVIVNLAHGGGGESWEEIREALVGGAVKVANAALDAKAEHLLFVSSIAALYLGDAEHRITADAPPDPNAETRGDYARAKAVAENEMLRMHSEHGLPVSIYRPGVVVGAGGPPFHSGIGFFNNETHCLGWNAGRNPLPLVLVEDVADALARACARPELAGKSLNLVGDVRLTAREYIADLGRALGRPLKFHPQSLIRQQAGEIAKWAVKRAAGRRVPFPSYSDLKSRGLVAPFDTSTEKHLLGWTPVSDAAEFRARAFDIHARAGG